MVPKSRSAIYYGTEQSANVTGSARTNIKSDFSLYGWTNYVEATNDQTETEAIAARQTAADYMGLPVPGGETLVSVALHYNYSDLDGFYYIQYVDGLEAALGEPSDITITPHEEL
jgi:hypothetical protein